MFLLTKPNKKTIQAFLDRCAIDVFSYKEIGASRTGSPPQYNADHNRILLGHGPDAFKKAKAAIRSWKMFDLSWVELCWPDAPIEVSQNVAVLVNHFGFHSLNACRIVYLIDDVSEIERFGFAYGTLTEHGETGEERFSVEFHPETGEVWYDLYAFSKPNHPLAILGYPISRMLQKRFAADSKEAMRLAVSS
jgi:uncharacterized protein (UPF0548 family)